jgi:site-specific recombinase XerC
LVGINLDDFQGEDVLLVRGKGKKERLVIVGEYARAALEAWLPLRQNLLRRSRIKTSALFFSVGPRPSIERLDARSVRRIIKAAAETRGLDPKHEFLRRYFTFILLRHYATHYHPCSPAPDAGSADGVRQFLPERAAVAQKMNRNRLDYSGRFLLKPGQGHIS